MKPSVRPSRSSRLCSNEAGVALIEFAFCLPILVIIVLWAVELANYSIVREQVSQLALQVSDNASRIGTQTSVQSEIDEGQVNDLFTGANLQAGRLDIAHNGRIILSSLEVDPDAPNGQYIHWQRCFGGLAYPSHYGLQGNGKGNTTLNEIGPANARVRATPTTPVMFVEIGYTYKPLIASFWAPSGNMTEIAAMMVRDNRDTSGPGINPAPDVTPSTC